MRRRNPMSVADQMARKRQLDQLRLIRPLTPKEGAEDDRLTMSAYQREWRKALAEREARRAGMHTG